MTKRRTDGLITLYRSTKYGMVYLSRYKSTDWYKLSCEKDIDIQPLHIYTKNSSPYAFKIVSQSYPVLCNGDTIDEWHIIDDMKFCNGELMLKVLNTS